MSFSTSVWRIRHAWLWELSREQLGSSWIVPRDLSWFSYTFSKSKLTELALGDDSDAGMFSNGFWPFPDKY